MQCRAGQRHQMHGPQVCTHARTHTPTLAHPHTHAPTNSSTNPPIYQTDPRPRPRQSDVFCTPPTALCMPYPLRCSGALPLSHVHGGVCALCLVGACWPWCSLRSPWPCPRHVARKCWPGVGLGASRDIVWCNTRPHAGMVSTHGRRSTLHCLGRVSRCYTGAPATRLDCSRTTTATVPTAATAAVRGRQRHARGSTRARARGVAGRGGGVGVCCVLCVCLGGAGG